MRTTTRPRKRSSYERILPSIYCLIVYSDRPDKYRDIDWDVDADPMSRFTTLLGAYGCDACERWMAELNCESEPHLFCSHCSDRASGLRFYSSEPIS